MSPLSWWSSVVVRNANCVLFGFALLFSILGGFGVLAIMNSTVDAGNEYFAVVGSDLAKRQFARDRRWQSSREQAGRQLHGPPSSGDADRWVEDALSDNADRRELRSARTGTALRLTLLYESVDGGNLLTPERLAETVAAESQLLRDFVRDFDVPPPSSNNDHVLADQTYNGRALHAMEEPKMRAGQKTPGRALDPTYAKQPVACGIQVSGLACGNGYNSRPDDQGYGINQGYHLSGKTVRGAPYYCGAEQPNICLFHDPSCDGGGMPPAWVLGCSVPSTVATSNLQGVDGSCCNTAHRESTNRTGPPIGTERWWVWCGSAADSGIRTVTLTDTCRGQVVHPPPPAPPAPPPLIPGTTEYAVRAALVSPPDSIANVLYARGDAGEWHYNAQQPLGDMGWDAHLQALAAHAAETALLPPGHTSRAYCADTSSTTSCVKDLRGHFESEFSPCTPTSRVISNDLAFSATALGNAQYDEARVIAWLYTQMDQLHGPSGPLRSVRLAWQGTLQYRSLRSADENATVILDAMWVGCALVIVLLLLVVQLRVLTPALLGWVQIVLCFPVSMFVYHFFLGCVRPSWGW